MALPHRLVPGAASAAGSSGVIERVIGLSGLLLAMAWLAWRFGPTIARCSGVALWWVGWCCGIAGGYGYALAFLAWGACSWATGTAWYAARRGYWPSPLSQRIVAPLLRLRGD